MPKKLRRLIVASCVIVFAMALFGATASGIDGVGVSVPQLQEPSQLTSSAPQVSVPSVSTPSVPSAPSVSTPSVTVPSVPSAGSTNLGGSGGGSGGGGSSSTSGGGSGGGGSGSSGGPASSSGGGGSPAAGGGSSSAGGGSGAFAKRGTSARKLAVERSQSRRLRREVKSMSGCLGSLPTMQRRVLGLRAGLAGSALSRGAAARKLGISGARELRLERGGLRSLRGASRAGGCGGGSGGGASQIAARSWAIPQLQPMATLSQPAPLVSPSSLSGDGASAAQQDVKGDTASSSGPAGPEAPDKATDSAGLVAAVAPASGDAASSGWTPVIIFVALCLAALAAASVLAGRQMLGAGSGGPAHEPLSWLPFAAPDLLATRREEAPGSGGAVHETAAMEEAPAAPVATAVAVAPHVNGNGNGNGHVAHANGNGNGNGHATQANGIDNGNGHAPHANGNGNGNGHVAHASGNGNGNGHADAAYASATAQRLGRPAAIVLSGLVSLGLSRAVRGRRRR